MHSVYGVFTDPSSTMEVSNAKEVNAMDEFVIISVHSPEWNKLSDQEKMIIALACYKAYIKRLLGQ